MWKKENKFLDGRINRIRLTSFIAYIHRRSDIRIFKNQYMLEYVNLILYWFLNSRTLLRVSVNAIVIFRFVDPKNLNSSIRTFARLISCSNIWSLHDSISWNISRIFWFFRSAAIMFDYFVASFLFLNLGVLNGFRTFWRALRSESS
jgi:hypothetical protein